MKKTIAISLLMFFFFIPFSALHAQDTQQRLNLPGDNLNLYAVLKLFQESPTLEDFEKNLNNPDSKINNLDLNNDDQVDYLKVIDHIDGNVHNIVLQDVTQLNENQDVAVIIVQKIKDNEVQIQIIGDEDLYGKDYIIEPNFESDDTELKTTPNPGFTGGGSQTIVVERVTTRQIYDWPIVQVIYMPSYVIWVSPWYWNYYPSFWHPWRPLYWHHYYGWHYHWNYYYFGHYRHWKHYRYNHWNTFYFSKIRSKSPTFIKIKVSGGFRKTYSRPDLIKKGSSEFRNKYPNSPSSNEGLPKIKNNNGVRPRVVNPKQNPIKENQISIPRQQNKPQIKNNEGINNTPREQPIKNRPSENRNNERKKDKPERQNNRKPKG